METIIGLGVLLVLAVPLGIGVLLLWVARLGRRVAVLERRLAAAVVDAASAAPVDAPAPPPLPPAYLPPQPPQEKEGARPVVAPGFVVSRPLPDPAAPVPPATPPTPGGLEQAAVAIRRWLTEGNVPVKVGMLVLLAGVAALLKYASDQGWLNAPIELRLAAISAAALAGLVFGWRQRRARPSFALALQGGTIGVMLLTVFAAFKLYALMPAAAAFGLSTVLVAALCVLAVLQDSRTLAVLGILAGFLAPIWLSTGSGNHVALFGYYALLNAAVFAIAWVRPWRVLNLLGFGFTFGIGTLWGVLQYRPDKFATTEPFLLLFFAFYLLIPVLFARRGGAGRVVDGSLVFGTPLVAFSLQAALLQGERMPLALCALGLAALYAALAAWGVRREPTRLLGQAHALLAVGFATLAVPLALSARATASVFALEGAGLVWLGLRQQRRLPQAAGVLLQAAAAVGFAFGVDAWGQDLQPVANPTCMSALLIAGAGFATAAFLRGAGRSAPACLAYLWGLAWWVGAVLHEILRFGRVGDRPDLGLMALALTAVLAGEAQRRRPAAAPAWTAMAALALAMPVAAWQAAVHAQPLAGLGGPAWGVFALCGARALWCLRRPGGSAAQAAQSAWLLTWPLLLSLTGAWLADRFALAAGWHWALLGGPWLALTALSLLRWRWLAWPLGAAFDSRRTALQATLFAVLGLGACAVLQDAASAAPLPWLPLLNPAELCLLAALALLARWLWSAQAPAPWQRRRVLALAVAGLALVTSSTLHSVHHWGGVPWDARLASASLAQTSLTVVWSVLGVVAWVLGSRRGQRTLWRTGAVLMALVLAKLVLIDRQHLGNLLGIGSFIAYGLLCTVVGYFAPAPPRQDPPLAETAP